MTVRICGTCIACCVYLNINEHPFHKEALVPCSHLSSSPVLPGKRDSDNMPLLTSENYQLQTEDNCKMGEQKPNCCSGYFCAWLLGEGELEDRPDRSGILSDQVAGATLIDGALTAKPLWLGAQDEEAGKRAIENLSRSSGLPVLVVEFTERRLLRAVGRGIK